MPWKRLSSSRLVLPLIGLTVAIPATVIQFSDADLVLSLSPSPPKRAQEGKVVWIVGASSGIGASLALDMAKDGAVVIISARRETQLKELAEKCAAQNGAGTKPLIIPLDVTKFEDHPKAVKQVLDTLGRIDILVLNSGISQRNLANDTPISVTENIMKTNFLSYVNLTKLVLPSMIEKQKGKIVVMSSLAGHIPLAIQTTYCASKFALQGFYNGLRPEVAPDNISISIVCPGPVESEIVEHAHQNPNNPPQEDGKKMPTERCTQLIVKGIYHNLDEMWISEQPLLWLTYLDSLFPSFAKWYRDNKLGPQRIQALKTGGNIYGEQKKN